MAEITTLAQLDKLLAARNDMAWKVREAEPGPEYDILGRPPTVLFEQYVYTAQAESALTALRAKAGQQSAAGNAAGLADTLRRTREVLELEHYRLAILYAHSMLSQGVAVHESALKTFLEKSPPDEQLRTRARIEQATDAAQRHMIELLEAPTIADVQRGIDSAPVSPLAGVYNEERKRLAAFAQAWDISHGIAPMSRTRLLPCIAPDPLPSSTASPAVDQSSVTPPEFPVDARRAGIDGSVLIRAYVSERGCAERLEIAQSAGYTPLDVSALGWAEGVRFHPALVGGKPQAVWHTFAVTFRLSD